MVALRALSAKQFRPPGRPFRALTPYYTRCTDRHKEFVLGDKPGILKHAGTLQKRIWKQYRNHLKRTTPLERAEFYVREMRSRGIRSYRALSLLLGEPHNRVWLHIQLLDLPEPVKAFLRAHREPQHLRYFTERRLRELRKVRGARAIWKRFREMIAECDREAGIWKPQSEGDRFGS
jgi:hypothetical protein